MKTVKECKNNIEVVKAGLEFSLSVMTSILGVGAKEFSHSKCNHGESFVIGDLVRGICYFKQGRE